MSAGAIIKSMFGTGPLGMPGGEATYLPPSSEMDGLAKRRMLPRVMAPAQIVKASGEATYWETQRQLAQRLSRHQLRAANAMAGLHQVRLNHQAGMAKVNARLAQANQRFDQTIGLTQLDMAETKSQALGFAAATQQAKSALFGG